MRDLFIPVNKKNINKNMVDKQDEKTLYSKNIYENHIEDYFIDYMEQCKWEEFIESILATGIVKM